MFRINKWTHFHIVASMHTSIQGIFPNEHLSLNKSVSYDIFKNQVQFQRSLVGFCVKLDHRAGIEQQTYRNQLFVLLDLLSSFRINSIAIYAIEFRSNCSSMQSLKIGMIRPLIARLLISTTLNTFLSCAILTTSNT